MIWPYNAEKEDNGTNELHLNATLTYDTNRSCMEQAPKPEERSHQLDQTLTKQSENYVLLS